MDQNRRELRRAAARAFLDSLDALQETLDLTELETAELSSSGTPHRPAAPLPPPAEAGGKAEATDQPPVTAPQPGNPEVKKKPLPQNTSNALNLDDLEQAIADIDQFMQARNSQGQG
ncbi:hypothetical protein BST81_20780 [Leptolyngbya sp. 'hensonii']|nr:hypothetical protein BST81_20780 [Leptolyngbya sp. 'hensonii']